jgi:hypothetical protein
MTFLLYYYFYIRADPSLQIDILKKTEDRRSSRVEKKPQAKQQTN